MLCFFIRLSSLICEEMISSCHLFALAASAAYHLTDCVPMIGVTVLFFAIARRGTSLDREEMSIVLGTE